MEGIIQFDPLAFGAKVSAVGGSADQIAASAPLPATSSAGIALGQYQDRYRALCSLLQAYRSLLQKDVRAMRGAGAAIEQADRELAGSLLTK